VSDYSNIPKYTIEALDRYVKQKIRTGDFLYAVLTNDLFGAVGKSDMNNRKAIQDICKYVYNHIPGSCWGSEEIVENWLRGGKNR
jgi:hypothetical protein